MGLRAQSYSIGWYKISGGGGTSTNGPFTLSGAIGQPDAGGAMTGGNFSLIGGFWSLLSVVQTAGAPLLSITVTNHQAVISWPAAATGWTLQTNTTLAAGAWGNYTNTIVNNMVTNGAPAGNIFFRLTQP
jgi:hypothetical protein